MSRENNPLADPKRRSPATQLVHGGTIRSEFHETSEALFLNSGYVYEDSAAAESTFKNNGPGYIYSRFSNPTVDMFQRRMALLEGADEARAVASGMARAAAHRRHAAAGVADRGPLIRPGLRRS